MSITAAVARSFSNRCCVYIILVVWHLNTMKFAAAVAALCLASASAFVPQTIHVSRVSLVKKKRGDLLTWKKILLDTERYRC
jgi:hypothetical protein